MQDGLESEKQFNILFVSPDSPEDCLPALQSLAGSVLLARDAREGRRLFSANGRESAVFHAAILDTALHARQWRALAAHIKKLAPDMPMILAARKAKSSDLEAGLREGAQLFLHRPLAAKTLRKELLPLMSQAHRNRCLRRRQSTAAAILDATPSPMVITDGVGVDYMNQPMMDLAGLQETSPLCHCAELEQAVPLMRIHGVDDHAEFLSWVRIALGDPDQEHLVRLSGTGETRSFLMRTTPLHDLEGRYSINFADVTSIENERRRFHRLATTDPLTGIFNRRKFMDALNAEIARSGRYGTELSLIMADIDDFKNVNDTLGHQAGDTALVELSALLRKHIRSMDILARYGGEEFAIIIPQTGLDGALSMAEKLRAKVARTAFSVAPNMTCSMGVAAFCQGDTAQSLLERADLGLYQAKAKGKNKVAAKPGVDPRQDTKTC